MRFWLERGIYGFRCDAVNVIYKSSFKDSVIKSVRKGREYYLSQPGNHLILKELKKDVLDNYDCFTVGEAGHVDKETAHLFCDKKSKELDMIFTFDHLETHEYLVKWFRRKFKPKKFFEKLSFWQKELEWNPIFFENHDQIRSVTDLGNDKLYWQESSKMLATLLLTLKGTPFIYQGEEIGMTNADFKSLTEIEDIESLNGYKMLRKWGLPKFLAEKFILKSSRDNCRTPFQWNDDKYAGFSTTKPPLKLCDNYQKINAKSQIKDKTSILSFYKQLISLRKSEETLVKGDFTEILITNHLFAYERHYQDKSLIIIVNSSNKKHRTSIKGELVLNNYNRTDFNGDLSPYEAVILRK
jgi:oligo-1,6-glucosidase